MQKGRRTGALLAAAALALASLPHVETARATTEATASSAPLKQSPTRTTSPVSAAVNRHLFGGWGVSGSRGWQRRRGPGWTQAHVQRTAQKKRNQARHRRAMKGKS